MTAHAGPPAGGRRVPVAVLGATGAVGQTFVRLLHDHPWFRLVEVAASERSVGRRYVDAARWIAGAPMPDEVRALDVRACEPGRVTAPIVFSALDSGVAGEVEAAFAAAGHLVLSNAKNHRMAVDVPLLVPEVNAPHLGLLEQQRARRGWKGGIVTNPNCAAASAVMPLAALQERFGLRRAFITTMQAVSGAGYPGVPSLDILGNVIPYIAEEEPKIERELPKMLGRYAQGAIEDSPLRVSAHANRVAVEHGHTVCVTVELERRASPDEAIAAMRDWRGAAEVRGLPSAPQPPIVVHDSADRPQPRRDVDAGGGMQCTVGRVREDPLLDLRFVALSHNTVRGAAGCSILNAELLLWSGLVPGA